MLKMKMKAESMEELLEDKSRMLSATIRENEKFKRIAGILDAFCLLVFIIACIRWDYKVSARKNETRNS